MRGVARRVAVTVQGPRRLGEVGGSGRYVKVIGALRIQIYILSLHKYHASRSHGTTVRDYVIRNTIAHSVPIRRKIEFGFVIEIIGTASVV
jgi:hypothetical protein